MKCRYAVAGVVVAAISNAGAKTPATAPARKHRSTLATIAAANLRYAYSVATSFPECPRSNRKFVIDVVSSFPVFVVVVAGVAALAFHLLARIPIRCS